jgi:hypothetical protein
MCLVMLRLLDPQKEAPRCRKPSFEASNNEGFGGGRRQGRSLKIYMYMCIYTYIYMCVYTYIHTHNIKTAQAFQQAAAGGGGGGLLFRSRRRALCSASTPAEVHHKTWDGLIPPLSCRPAAQAYTSCPPRKLPRKGPKNIAAFAES